MLRVELRVLHSEVPPRSAQTQPLKTLVTEHVHILMYVFELNAAYSTEIYDTGFLPKGS